MQTHERIEHPHSSSWSCNSATIMGFTLRKGGGEYRVQTFMWNICQFEANLPLKDSLGDQKIGVGGSQIRVQTSFEEDFLGRESENNMFKMSFQPANNIINCVNWPINWNIKAHLASLQVCHLHIRHWDQEGHSIELPVSLTSLIKHLNLNKAEKPLTVHTRRRDWRVEARQGKSLQGMSLSTFWYHICHSGLWCSLFSSSGETETVRLLLVYSKYMHS